MTFQSLGLMPELVRALTEKGYTEPTSIQQQAIPLILGGRDVLGGAQTGTGKTGAFSLPVLQRLAQASNTKTKGPRVLVLVPTRELAAQVQTSVRDYGKHLRIRSTVVYGGAGMGPQVTALQRGVDILVATPGRLIDHLERGSCRLDGVETLILDEADRMLDMGFLPAIRKILTQIPKQRQTLLFSATFEASIKQLATQFMNNPQHVQVAAQNTVAQTVQHSAHPVDPERKRDLLVSILRKRPADQILVFIRTKHMCGRIAESLDAAGIPAAAIHGNKSQSQRLKALADFKSGKIRVLCATDVAARGLDIPLLPMVINYDLPMVAEDYVHRIGRTGRAGASGEAISLVATDEGGLLRAINRLLKTDIALSFADGFELTGVMDMNAVPVMGNRGRGGRSNGEVRQTEPRGGRGTRASNGSTADRTRPANRERADRTPDARPKSTSRNRARVSDPSGRRQPGSGRDQTRTNQSNQLASVPVGSVMQTPKTEIKDAVPAGVFDRLMSVFR